MIDIAREAGVSVATVGHVLAGSGGKNVRVGVDTHAKITEIAKVLNYRPNHSAQQLAGKKSNVIAVAYNPQSSPFIQRMFAEMEGFASKLGYRLLVGNPTFDKNKMVDFIDELLSRGVDGLLCLHHGHRDPELFPTHAMRLGNVVFLGKPPISGASYVTWDDTDGTRRLVRHLIESGRKRPALLIADEIWRGTRQRKEGYLAELEAAGYPADNAIIWVGGDRVRPDPQMINDDMADAIIDEVVIAGKADSLLCQTDYWAAVLIRRLKARGLGVPQDVAVASYDNFEFAEFLDPQLTTLDPQASKIAKAAVDMLHDMIRGKVDKDLQKSIVVQPRLAVRCST
jgi:DNA-binding LacI/PurR family transcriptional regulator